VIETAMTEKKITVAPQDHVELYENTARRFFREVLDCNFDDCLITDESYLSDFSSCGMPDELADATSSTVADVRTLLDRIVKSAKIDTVQRVR
jgi:hypothetical protein